MRYRSRVRLLERLSLVFGGLFAVATALRMCALIFGCGCTWSWSGAASHCNIHTPGVPHCPFCVMGSAGLLYVVLPVLIAQASLLYLARRRFGRRLPTSLLAVLAGYAGGTALAGFVSALAYRYPYFLGARL